MDRIIQPNPNPNIESAKFPDGVHNIAHIGPTGWMTKKEKSFKNKTLQHQPYYNKCSNLKWYRREMRKSEETPETTSHAKTRSTQGTSVTPSFAVMKLKNRCRKHLLQILKKVRSSAELQSSWLHFNTKMLDCTVIQSSKSSINEENGKCSLESIALAQLVPYTEDVRNDENASISKLPKLL